MGESQDCSCVARGWSSSLFLVLLSYACKEALRIDRKLEVEEDAVGGETWDMGCSTVVGARQTQASSVRT
jgi:hypothetical protein